MIKPVALPHGLELVTSQGGLYKGDCLDFFPLIKDCSVDCVFADPPFNLNKNYGSGRNNDSVPEDAYFRWTQQWLTECVRILKPGGSLFVYHLPKWLITIGSYLNTNPALQFRHWISIKMKNGFPIKHRLHPAHYGLLYYVKLGKPFKFHIVRIPSPTCRHCGELIRDYGGYKNKYKTVYKDRKKIPLIQLADFWDDTTPNIHRKRRPYSVNELPVTIPERAILLSTNKSDIVLDPFAGGGSTLYAAGLNDRYWIGCEIGDIDPAREQILGDTQATLQAGLPHKLQRIFQTPG